MLALRALPWKLIGYAGIAFAILALFAHDRITLAQNGKLKAQLSACTQARQADRTSYETAQKQAAEQNELQIHRIESEQERVSEKISGDYSRDLARLRAEFMRSHSPAQGASGGAQASPVPETAGGPDAENVCIPRSLVLRAQEIELGRNALIDWINEQAGVQR